MTAFVAKMLTLLGVMLYAGGPIDAVTLIVQGDGGSQTQEAFAEHMAPEPQFAPSHAVVAGADLNVDNEVQKSAVSVSEMGLRSGIGFAH